MLEIIATVIGILAVVIYIASYQFKNRKAIVFMYTVSNFLYVVQYILLGAFTGMAMDTLAFIVSILASKRDNEIIYKYRKVIIAVFDALMIIAGLVLYENIFSLFAIVGVILETTALWNKDENKIRILTLIGSPFWLTYNTASMAVGSILGNVINIVSLTIALIRYRKKPTA